VAAREDLVRQRTPRVAVLSVIATLEAAICMREDVVERC
jgi:hypothetical protein